MTLLLTYPATRTCPICGEQIDAQDFIDAFCTPVDNTPTPARRMLNQTNYHERAATNAGRGAAAARTRTAP